MSVQIDGSTGNIIAIKADYSGDVSIGGTLTYEDVTNIDAVGLITARNGIKVDDLGVQVGTGATIDGATNTLTFLTNGSERLRVTSGGDVGIGTVSPTTKLHLTGNLTITKSSNNPAIIFDEHSGTDPKAKIQMDQTNSTNASLLFFTEGSGTLSERMRLDSSGNFGVGTDSPGQLLQVGVPNSATASFRAGTSLVSIDAGYQSSNVIGTAAAPALIFGGDSNTGYWHPASDTLAVSTAGSERLRIDSSGRLLLGFTSARANFFNGSDSPKLQLESTSFINSAISCVRNSNNNAGGGLVLGKTRGTSVGSNTVVQSGDSLGQVSFQGSDGSEMVEAAKIAANIDATPGANDMPGRLVFMTTADGASSTTERMRINSSGNVLIGDTSDSIYNDTSGGGINLKGDGQLVLAKQATSSADPLIWLNDTGQTTNKSIVFAQDGSEKANIGLAGNDATVTVNGSERMRINSSGQLLVGATSAGSADKALVSGQLNAGGVRFASLAKSCSVSSSVTFDISGSNEGYVFVRIRIKVGYSGNANYQMHAQYDYATCNYSTSGATATQTGILQVESGNAQFNYSDITVSRPSNRTVRVTYAPSSGSGTHTCKVMVDGSFDSIS